MYVYTSDVWDKREYNLEWGLKERFIDFNFIHFLNISSPPLSSKTSREKR